MRTVAIIQARMGSSRFPGKVMKTLCGRTVLGHVIDRVYLCTQIQEIVVATTELAQDNVITQEVKNYGVSVFRGDENNVLARYYEAAKQSSADVIVRITSDCPLLDPILLTEMLAKFYEIKANKLPIDYLSNTITRTYPRGFDVEIFTFHALEKANDWAKKSYDLEHVTPFIYQNVDIFSIHEQKSDIDLSTYRWTIDTLEDFQLIEAIYTVLYEPGKIFSTESVLKLLKDKPELKNINAHIQQKTR